MVLAQYTQRAYKGTAQIINSVSINYLSTLELWLEDDAKDNFFKHFNDFTPLDDTLVLEEQKRF
ncbi:MAG: hypothetical protein Q9M40_01905 [Sulfurimonas sp.]|nr:hypothetical protein [Sulfurimonas sp.]